MATRLASGIACPAVAGAVWAGEAWEVGPSLITQRTHFGAAVDPCGDIYVAGGGETCNVLLSSAEILRFDGETGTYALTWEPTASMTTARHAPAVVHAAGFIFVIGGHDGQEVSSTFERYDTTASAPVWSLMSAELNVPRQSAAAVTDQWGRIWVIGGRSETGGLDSVEVYDPARPELGWVLHPAALNEGRFACGAGVDELGRIFVIGGTGPDLTTHLRSVERLDPCDEAPVWELVGEMVGSNSQNDRSAVGADGRIYVAGGWMPGYSSQVTRYDPATDAWEIWTPLGVARSNVVLAPGKDGSLFAIGGDNAGCPGLDLVEILPGPSGGGCARPILLDADGNGRLETVDLLVLLANWGAWMGGCR